MAGVLWRTSEAVTVDFFFFFNSRRFGCVAPAYSCLYNLSVFSLIAIRLLKLPVSRRMVRAAGEVVRSLSCCPRVEREGNVVRRSMLTSFAIFFAQFNFSRGETQGNVVFE